ncbi:MAG: carboxypeptidase-like regulatory domain-containing protein [Bacteroidales bacterium]|nr:carboxypeptidase-like regulatory domain-containing protein [Bacteroidales bacterium]
MNHGKEICRELKELRQRIAEENNIPLKMEECTFKGECDGTCPRCDAEVNYLETALADRLRLGKAAMVAGISLGLVATAMDANCQTLSLSAEPPVVKEIVQQADSVTIKGRVVDAETKKGIEFANIRIFDNRDSLMAMTTTDQEGNFAIQLPKGKYDIVVTYPSFIHYRRVNFDCTKECVLPTIRLKRNTPKALTGIVLPDKKHHFFGRKKQRSGGKK